MKNRTLFLLTTLISVSANSVQANSTKLINPDNLHSYQRFDTVTTWPKAKNSCANKGGYLSTITSQAENDWVWSKFGASPADYIGYVGFWLGGNDSATEGQWTWITGESWSYSNWSPSNPNNDGTQNYLAMWDGKYDGSSAGTWDDGSNHFIGSYLCEWNPLKTYTEVTALPDLNINGSQEIALVGELGENYMLFVYDSSTLAVINETVVKPKKGYAVKSITLMDDVNGNNAPELAVLITATANNKTVLQLHDSLTGTVVKTIALPTY